jgi:hypothetical protein
MARKATDPWAVGDRVYVVTTHVWCHDVPPTREYWTLTKVGRIWLEASSDPQHRGARQFAKATGLCREQYGSLRLTLYRDKATYDETVTRQRLWDSVVHYVERHRPVPAHLTTGALQALLVHLMGKEGV